MNAAAMRARVKRLTELVNGLAIEAAAVFEDRGSLNLQEWNRYVKATYDARDALHEARSALQAALSKQQGTA
jgi:hypothetical protein